MDTDPRRWQVRDRYGNSIYMTAKRWNHALASRPWLGEFLNQALETVRQGRRQQDPLNPRKYKYYRGYDELLPDYNHLVVVVLFAEQENDVGETVPNNYVTNVWAVYLYGKR